MTLQEQQDYGANLIKQIPDEFIQAFNFTLDTYATGKCNLRYFNGVCSGTIAIENEPKISFICNSYFNIEIHKDLYCDITFRKSDKNTSIHIY